MSRRPHTGDLLRTIQEDRANTTGGTRALLAVLARATATVRRSSPRALLGVLLLQVVAALAAVATIRAAQVVVEAVVEIAAADASRTRAYAGLVLLVGATAVTAAVAAIREQLQRTIATRVDRSVWESILDRVGRTTLESFEDRAFHEQLRRIETTALVRPFQVTMGLTQLTGGALTSVVVVVGLAVIEPLVVGAVLVGALPLTLLGRWTGRIEFSHAVATSENVRRRRYLRETLLGRQEAKELKLFAAFDSLRADHDDLFAAYVADVDAHARRRGGLQLVGAAISAAVLGAAMLLVVQLVATGSISVGESAAALVAVRLLGNQVEQTSKAVTTLLESSLFLSDLEAFIDGVEEEPRPTEGTHGALEELRIESVSFRYPGAKADTVANVDLEIRRGEIVALVGENGSGKTTLAKVLAQLFRPTEGTVRWNGDHVLQPVDARRHVSVVFQDFGRYDFTAAQNVAMELTPAVGTEKVRHALDAAGLGPQIGDLPSGLDTLLGREFGVVDLSVGQWQRLALARAAYRSSSLVILDEPTAAVDAHAEHEFFAGLRRTFADAAIVVITHRLPTIAVADRVYVLEDGRIAQHGALDALIEADGPFRRIFEEQIEPYRAVLDAASPAGVTRPTDDR